MPVWYNKISPCDPKKAIEHNSFEKVGLFRNFNTKLSGSQLFVLPIIIVLTFRSFPRVVTASRSIVRSHSL